jgi:hypothetical protein
MCCQELKFYSHTLYFGNSLPPYGTGIVLAGDICTRVARYDSIFARVFPITLRLARIHAMHKLFSIIVMHASGLCLSIWKISCLNTHVRSVTVVILGHYPHS